jgi:hypothetical protein
VGLIWFYGADPGLQGWGGYCMDVAWSWRRPWRPALARAGDAWRLLFLVVREEEDDRALSHAGVLVLRFAPSTTRCCGGGDVRHHGWFCPTSGSVEDARRYGRKSCLAIIGLAATTPAGVVPLLGGVAEVC